MPNCFQIFRLKKNILPLVRSQSNCRKANIAQFKAKHGVKEHV